ncbi:MAG: hypothetical protein MJ193_01380 [Clostridia bacterium]|nr:hypothetical protein [Clostridia bacterium]
MNYFLNDFWPKEKVFDQMNAMNGFGLRVTGTVGQRNYCAWLKDQIKEMGLEPISTPYEFKRWEATDSSLTIDGEDIHISSPFPYSGLTDEAGVTGKLCKVHNTPLGFQKARGKIAVCRIKDLGGITSKIAFNKRNSMPENLNITPYYRGPVASSFLKTLLTFWAAKFSGMKGMICIWEDMSDDMVEGQWLNFILDYLKVPMVWVNETTGKKVMQAAKEKKTATLRLIGSIEEKAQTESFYVVVKGKGNTNESIIINTHTDGCNFVEENGGIGMLPMIKYFKENPVDRNLIFVFVTGHFRLPVFRVGHLTSNQATGRWLDENKAVWKGKKAQYPAVAGVCVEHLGCTEWKDVDGKYTQTNDVDIEMVYTGNKTMDKIYYEAIKDRELVRTITVRAHNTMHFGEGQTMFARKVPEIALVTAPDYLCSVDPTGNHHMDKFNLDLMYEQIHPFINIVKELDKHTAKEFGKPQAVTFGLGKLK